MTRAANTVAFGLLTVVCMTRVAGARPAYFDTFTALYAVASGDRLDACGVCHLLWEGTGARNAFGSAVEQQLYLGKSITQSLIDVESDDADGDGFTNVDEIVNFMTLPGYSCADFQDASGAPTDYHTYIEPLVASCLEPLDIRVSSGPLSFLTEAGAVDSLAVEIFNNGTDFSLHVTSVELLAGSSAEFALNGPTAPFSIPVGSSATVNVTFSPSAPVIAGGTLRIGSDDPDESVIDIGLSGFGFVKTLASPQMRRSCRGAVDRAYRRYVKSHLGEWARCHQAELSGVACDTGRRALKLERASEKLRASVGGRKDRVCAGAGLTPSLLDVATTCGGSCADITVSSIGALADCLVCRQEESMQALLLAAMGSAPPDLPPSIVGDQQVLSCQRRLLKSTRKGVLAVMKVLAACELDNVTAATPAVCVSSEAAALAKIHSRVDGASAKCKSSAGLAGCLFVAEADPLCLGDTVQAVGAALVDEAIAEQE